VTGVLVVTPSAVCFEADIQEDFIPGDTADDEGSRSTVSEMYNLIAPMENIMSVTIASEISHDRLTRSVYCWLFLVT